MEKYTKEQTAKFLTDRNNRRNVERVAKKIKNFVWDSSKGAFRGSIRNQFTGPKRNNQVYRANS